jgi:hypothetical protein
MTEPEVGFYKFNIKNLKFTYYPMLPFNFRDIKLKGVGFSQYNTSIVISSNKGVFIKNFDSKFFCE